MKVEKKEFAEKALKHLCIGSQIDGIRFGLHSSTTLLYFMNYDKNDVDRLWIHIESKWTLYSKAQDTYP